MKKDRSLKQRLIATALTLVMLVSSLLGTTFAWFTDSVTSAGNTIQAGNLKIDLSHKVDDDWISLKQNPDHKVFDYDKWEPSYTRVESLKIDNLGSLALQYRLSIEVKSETAKLGDNGENLADVIDVYVIDGESDATSFDTVKNTWTYKGTLSEVMKNPSTFLGGELLPAGEVLDANAAATTAVANKTVSIALHMQENAGNEYQKLSVGNIYVNLIATQWSYEDDSFGNEYDKDAIFPEINIGGITVDVTTQNNVVTQEATVNGIGVTAKIPAGVTVQDGVNKLGLSVTEKAESDANLTLNDGEALRSLDVHMDGVADNNTVPMLITIEKAMKVGLNIGNYTLYHVEDGVSNAMTAVNDPSELDAHNEFYYDPATGDVTLAMATFSEVAMVAETDSAWKGNRDYSWYTNAVAPVADGEPDYVIANADQLAGFSAIVGGMAKDENGNFLITYTDSDGDAHHNDSFSGKTIKLIADINLGDKESENNPNIIFYPIGYWNNEGTYERKPVEERTTAVESGFYSFEGTFDGNGNTISNFYQNTWEMKGDHNWYDPIKEQYYRDGMGLFGKVYGGTVRNLTVSNFSSDGEIATTGVIAAYADGATFENIAIFDCNPRVYNIGNGGIVGCVGWYAKEAGLTTTFTNITVDNSNKISALWGSYDVACGGIVGQYYPTSGQTSANKPANGGVHFENCHVSAIMDVYNDVCANYQYYAYRYTGMLIGSVRENETIDGHVYPKMDGITASGCTVYFGDWNDYYYCELVANSLASYTHDHQFSRLEQVKSVDVNNMTVTTLKGETVAIPTSGRVNYVVVKGEHATENATCYHFVDGKVHDHDDYDGDGVKDYETVNGESVFVENNRHIYLEFNNLVTGYGWGVTSKGVGDLAGVTILDRAEGNSVEKFEGKVTELSNGTEIKLGDIFSFIDNGVELVPGALAVGVTNVDENNPVSATVEYDRTNWENSTVTFTGTGTIQLTIQDYYFCTPTTITVEINNRTAVEKFDLVFENTEKYLYRVGNQNTVTLGSLFKAKDGAQIGTVSVTVEAIEGTAASGTYTSNATWTNGTLQFSDTGVVKVTITDNDYCTPTALILEVVDATNVTGLSGTISGNVVLLNDCSLSSLTVNGRNTVYGNGFTATYTGNGQYLNNGLKQGVINVSENGMLDNLRVVASIYPAAYLYYSEAQDGPKDEEGTKTRYHYQLSAVTATGNATIQNCYIYGGRTNIYIGDGNITVKDSVLECGTLANSQIISSNEYTVTFENVTTIQHQVNATVGDTKAVMLGAGILVGDGDKDNTTITAPTISLKGTFKQYNWVTNEDKNAVSDDNAKMIIGGALGATAYNHTINGTTASNMGIIYLNDGMTVSVENDTELPYIDGTVSLSLNGLGSVSRPVYSLQGGTESQIYSDYENADRSTVNGLYQPQFKYNADLGGQYIAKTDDGDEFLYGEGDTIKVMFPSGDTKEINLSDLVDIIKYTNQNLTLEIVCKDSDGNNVTVTNGKITLSAAGTYTVTYTVTDTLFFNKDGSKVTDSVKYSWNVLIETSLKEVGIPNAEFEFDTSVQKIFRSGNSNIVQFIPFLSGLKIYDYDENGVRYLRFDGGNTESTTDYSKITGASIENVNTTGEAQGYHIVTIELADGGKLVIDMDVRANSGSSTHTGSIKVRNNVIYVVNNGTTSGKGQTWTIYSYKFVGNNGTEIDSGKVVFGTSGTDCDTATKPTSNFDSDTGSGGSGGDSSSDNCITGDTLITLADGTQKRMDEIVETDLVRVFNHETGSYEVMPLLYYVNDGVDEYHVINLAFADGTVTRLIGEHALFDMTLNCYVYIREDNYEEFVGHRFAKDDGNGGFISVELVDAFITEEVVGCYSITSLYHLNYYIDGMLSLPGAIDGLFNYFEYDPETLQYDQEQMLEDIETYGLYTYEDFAEYATPEMFNTILPAQYLKVAVGKGMITYEGILELLFMYLV